MKVISMQRTKKTRRRGAMLVLMLLLLPVLILVCGIAVNTAYMELSRTELQVASDAAARAGGREFIISRSQMDAETTAKHFASLNLIANTPLQLQDSDIEFGISKRAGTAGRYNFTPNSAKPNALRVTSNRTTGSASGPIPLFLPALFGTSNFEASQMSVSSLVEVDVALVIDRSGSMAYAAAETADLSNRPMYAPPGWQFCDPAPPQCRWRDVVAAVQVFLDEVNSSPSDELVSLTTYNHDAHLEQTLTDDYDDILLPLDFYTQGLCAGGTNIGSGINFGSQSLMASPSRPGAIKVIVVLTDGIHNWGTSPVQAANVAAGGGVQIFTVTFADEADISLMQSVANTGGGTHIHATSASDLSIAFREIARRLPTLLTE